MLEFVWKSYIVIVTVMRNALLSNAYCLSYYREVDTGVDVEEVPLATRWISIHLYSKKIQKNN